jgi:hypothetical protein
MTYTVIGPEIVSLVPSCGGFALLRSLVRWVVRLFRPFTVIGPLGREIVSPFYGSDRKFRSTEDFLAPARGEKIHLLATWIQSSDEMES